ncbi:MAG: VOC family protein [Burkholderiales bacterium]|nr:VOC family protein [Burkholderiales bacterium]
MVARLDHITVVAPNLEAGAAYVESALGVLPGPGRTHPGMGTHNLLLALGSDVYLEVISIDPGSSPPRRPRWFGLDGISQGSAAGLAAWVASTVDIAAAAVPELGEIETMRREQHTWRMTLRADGSLPLDGAAPLLIQRSGSIHPAAALPPAGLLLRRLRIRHPAPSRVVALFARMGLASQPSVTVTEGPECSLVAEIQTPFGPRELGKA